MVNSFALLRMNLRDAKADDNIHLFMNKVKNPSLCYCKEGRFLVK